MKGIFLVLLLIGSFIIGQSQEKTRHMPFSFYDHRAFKNTIHISEPLNLEHVYQEDALQLAEHSQFNVARLQTVKTPKAIKLNTMDNGQSYWKQTYTAHQAEQIALKISDLYLPVGSELFFYSDSDPSVLSFDAGTQAISKKAVTSAVFQGQSISIEYNAQAFVDDLPRINIEGLINFYPPAARNTPGFGQSTHCEVNTACAEGDAWCKETQSVVRILVQSGNSYSYCSGAVINNANKDFTPYILTAEHCGAYANDEDFNYWKFDFNYQSLLCESPDAESEIISHHKTGCINLAQAARFNATGSDFRLLKLNEMLPEDWNIYYAGWDANEHNTIDKGGVGIHHPNGDIKKISTYTQTLYSSDANGGTANDWYWETPWAETDNGHGITEGGSSGSPIFDYQGYIIGTLATGSSFCTAGAKTSPDYYGKFSKHWDANGSEPYQQLKHWLDPNNTGIKKLDGIAGNDHIKCAEKLNFPSFVIFPNPASTHINIASNHMQEVIEAEVEIYNLQGKLLMQNTTSAGVNVKQIDIRALSEGIYILKAKKNDWLIQKKFVILR